LDQLLRQNVTRIDFAQRYQRIVDQYNSGGSATENYFDDLIKFTRDLNEEAERHIREGLTVEELELFDLIKKDKLTQAEELALKNKELLSEIAERKEIEQQLRIQTTAMETAANGMVITDRTVTSMDKSGNDPISGYVAHEMIGQI
jgi:phosphoglycerate-specific signal transduction histidine kinase